MKLNVDSFLPFPREVVFRTCRDRLVELVPFLPNIRGIEEKSRRDDGLVAHIVNVWQGGGDIPKVARAVLSEKMLTWTDNATWDEGAWVCAWRMEAHSFKEAVHAQGRNEFRVADGGCTLAVLGDLEIDGKKLPIPRFLAGTIAPAVEKFLGAMIRPNLTETAKGVARFLEARARKL
ncbi:MAG: hypothetical protein EXR72_00840 [Myxococcales bacterium]|nr:hypothetical protein [Myxococcales bacterium]